ncbi:SatD family protein [Dermatophilaceae bacterium Sec6.4]
MTCLKESVRATLIGDIVTSREAHDRQELHVRLLQALHIAGRDVAATSALTITVGDEFQGAYRHLGEALAAAFAVRLALLPETQVRFGFGWGRTQLLDAATGIQDGPGWWAAREAIEAAEHAARQPATRAVRTVFVAAQDDGPATGAVNAALLCQDQLLSSLDERSTRILIHLAAGGSRTTIAAHEGISVSAVSQRIRAGGLEVILAAADELASVR